MTTVRIKQSESDSESVLVLSLPSCSLLGTCRGHRDQEGKRQGHITSCPCVRAEFLPQRTIAIWRWDIISMHPHPFQVEATNTCQNMPKHAKTCKNHPLALWTTLSWLGWSHNERVPGVSCSQCTVAKKNK